MKLFLIRHGENQANLDRVFSYKTVDFSLTSKGVKQAKYLAEWIAYKQVVKVYSSPLKRARETSQIVTEFLRIPQAVVLEELRELNVGMLEGKSDAASWKLHDSIIQSWIEGKAEVSFDSGENHINLIKRLKCALDCILTDNLHLEDEQSIAVVAHGGLFTYGLPWLCNGFSDKEIQIPLLNTAVIVIEVTNGLFHCLGWGLCEHLSQIELL